MFKRQQQSTAPLKIINPHHQHYQQLQQLQQQLLHQTRPKKPPTTNLPSLGDTESYYPQTLFFNTNTNDRMISKLNSYLNNAIASAAATKANSTTTTKPKFGCSGQLTTTEAKATAAATAYTTKTSYNSSPVRVGGSPSRKLNRQTNEFVTNIVGEGHTNNNGIIVGQQQTKISSKKLKQAANMMNAEVYNIYGLIRSIPGTHCRPCLPPCFKTRQWLIEPPFYQFKLQQSSDDYLSDR